MRLRERMYELTSPDEVDEFLERFPTGALFKAGSCHKTMQGFSYVEEALDPREEIHLGFIRVVECRPASNHVATLTDIQHESPQFILFKQGKPVFDLDNWDIVPESLDNALESHLGGVEKKEIFPPAISDVSNYVSLLEQYVQGDLSEEAFKQKWLWDFAQDATPRAREEFDLLNSLFGDVDRALQGGLVSLGGKGEQPLKGRALKLLDLLKMVTEPA